MPTLVNTTGLPHLGRIVQRELLSVALPGAIVLIEIWLLVASRADIHRHGGFLHYASSETSSVNTGVLVIAILVGAISAYGIGLVLRMAIWRLFELLFRRQEPPDAREIIELLMIDFGEDQVDQVLGLHKPLEHLRRTSPSAARRSRLKVSRLVTQPDEFLSYCKSWLRLHQPELGVDHLEAQINFLVTLTPPLLISAFVIARHTSWSALVVSLPATALVAWCFVHLSWIRRTWEPIDSVRYFFLAQWFDEAGRKAPPPSKVRTGSRTGAPQGTRAAALKNAAQRPRRRTLASPIPVEPASATSDRAPLKTPSRSSKKVR